MTDQEKNTEEIIFDAAKDEFIEKGFDGTRMQEIAKRAGINKALLHYYYRTKEKLFDAIFEKVFNTFMPNVFEAMQSKKPLHYKIEVFVSSYLTFIYENPHIPSFILHELNRNPERLTGLFGSILGTVKEKGFSKFAEAVREETKEGIIMDIEPEQLIVNIIALCIFPVVARPIIQGVIFENDKSQYAKFLESRKTEVAKFVINSIYIKK
jgi:TetR/AcrR family transcriptional regulator